MALELGPPGIRPNCVNPTVVLTPLGRAAWADAAKRDPMLASIPLGRFAEVGDVEAEIGAEIGRAGRFTQIPSSGKSQDF